MNYATIREMIECATPTEKRQFKAQINVHLDSMRKVRRAIAEAERRLEYGIDSKEDRRQFPPI